MGAWGPGTFQNDDALDWVDEFERVDQKLEFVEATLAFAIATSKRGDYMDLPIGSHALAAAEVVAALRGRPSDNLPDYLKEWVSGQGAQPGEKLLEMSRQAIWAVTAESEIKGLWEEGGADAAAPWFAVVNDLSYRLVETAP